MRIYVLVASCKPLRIFIYREGLVRLATRKYSKVNEDNKKDLYQHLTNYAINKTNKDFLHEDDKKNNKTSHKQSLRKFFKQLRKDKVNVPKIWNGIKKICAKTVIAIAPILLHNYNSCQSDDPYNQMCFEILGFDIMIDSNLKPYLLEVNHSPSFRTDYPIDEHVKGNLIYDTLNMMNISVKERNRLKQIREDHLKHRTMTGQRLKISEQFDIEKSIKEKDEYMVENAGDYERIFPSLGNTNEEPYHRFMKEASAIYNKFTGAEVLKSEIKVDRVVSKNKIFNSKSKYKRIEMIYGKKSAKKKKKKSSMTVSRTKLPNPYSLSSKKTSIRFKEKNNYPIVETNALGRVTSTEFGLKKRVVKAKDIRTLSFRNNRRISSTNSRYLVNNYKPFDKSRYHSQKNTTTNNFKVRKIDKSPFKTSYDFGFN